MEQRGVTEEKSPFPAAQFHAGFSNDSADRFFRQRGKRHVEGERNMEILKPAAAGTLESSDAQVTVEPGENGVELSLTSSVMNQYGRQIRAVVLETLQRLEVTKARVTVVDKGALDCTIKARVECAVLRSCGQSAENIPWGGAIR